ncbi:hypothetical protein GCM10010168_83970 [Actinoplanes ianthinogenes]|uniref:HNH domain-containing protein n=1 Tax=Actinoplanes ianthinogenes TaxID=122358 RepID=A0ABM7M0F6_9ACTN|nr:hypothetical protein Aiant_56860 [Actinoplanes ianthinogenes]GGR52324.1 hypothetical protein GCM10010168_83970 [Actinoplanes ianthinogenes]
MHYSRFKAHGDPLAPGRRRQPAYCVVAGCDEQSLAKDLCRRHYYAQRRGAPLVPPKPTECTELGCGLPVHGLGLCDKHYARSRLSLPIRRVCFLDNCEERATSRGLCGAHYQRWRRFGDPEFHPPQAVRKCTIDGCDEVTNGRGLCSSHYYRWWRYGDPLISKNRPRIRQPVYQFGPRACVTCGREFDPGASSVRLYCGKRCKPSGRIAGSVNKRSWVEKLGAEDGWTCWLCKAPVDPALYWPHRWAGSVDHVVHVSNGGTDERSNLRLAHLTCNVSRQNSHDEHQP